MRLTVGFTQDAPQHELTGPIADLLTNRFLDDAIAIGVTRSLIKRAEFLDAINAPSDFPTSPALAEFIDHIRGEEDEQMVQLKWWD